MSIVYSAASVSTVVNYPLSSVLCKTGLDGGWPMIFYTPGIVGLILAFIFPFVVFSEPSQVSNPSILKQQPPICCQHPRISAEEKKYLMDACKQMKVSTDKSSLNIPWRQVLSSKPIHALWMTHVAHSWCFYLTAVNIPLFIKDVFNMEVMQVRRPPSRASLLISLYILTS